MFKCIDKAKCLFGGEGGRKLCLDYENQVGKGRWVLSSVWWEHSVLLVTCTEGFAYVFENILLWVRYVYTTVELMFLEVHY